MPNEKEPLNLYRNRLLSEVKLYNIRITELVDGVELSRSTVHSFYHKDKRTNRGNLDIIDKFLEKNYRSKDIGKKPTINIEGNLITQESFLRAFFDNLNQLRKFGDFQIYEADLKKSGVIDYLEQKDASVKISSI